MATKSKSKEKQFNYAQATVDELNTRLSKTQQELFKLRFRAASAPLTNTMQIRHLRREVARLNTFVNQKSSGQPVAAAASKKPAVGAAVAEPKTKTKKATAVAAKGKAKS